MACERKTDFAADVCPEPNEDFETALATFREKWQQELQTPISTSSNFKDLKQQNSNDLSDTEESSESLAKMWFLKGADLEKLGDFYAAIQYYKRAVQLVPDIEFKISQKFASSAKKDDLNVEESLEDFHINSSEEIDNDDEEIKGDLLDHIQRKLCKDSNFCVPELEQKFAHISLLPMEILFYIFKWVVSSDLDLRSLEMCSLVCRGFYLCSRDSEIWRLACLRAWGGNCGRLSPAYPTWREMYIQRPRLHYSGCYISKTTYIRHGENSFKDQFYRPWHLVAYYRYLRFFPEGLVLMLTTSDEPQHCVSLLRSRTAKAPTLFKGHYRLKDDRVLLVVQDASRQSAYKSKKIHSKHGSNYQDSAEQTFHLEFQILNQSNKRKHVQLMWIHYSVLVRHRNGNETQCAFDISSTRYPPLWFSRVKSYTKETSLPLQ